MKVIVGLGNPGKEYTYTRHNVGFLVLDYFLGNIKWQDKMESQIFITNIGGEKVCFVKPQNYMNLSGSAVRKVMSYYKVDIEDLLVIHDDLDLEKKSYKLKAASSSGGHNGVKDIISKLNTNEFLRLKIGVANNKSVNTKDYVLDKLSKSELNYLNSPLFGEIIETFVLKGKDETMHIYNTLR